MAYVCERLCVMSPLCMPSCAPTQREYYKPLQVALVIKEKNGGKLNSHLWFFAAFVKQLQPSYCVVSEATPPRRTRDPLRSGVCSIFCTLAYLVHRIDEALSGPRVAPRGLASGHA